MCVNQITPSQDTKPHRQFPFSEIIDALEYDLSSATDPEIGDPENAHTFKIVTTKRTLLLCAPGEEDEIKWLGAIRALIARRTNPSHPSGTSAGASQNEVSSGGIPVSISGVKPKGRRLSAVSVSGLPGKSTESSASAQEHRL